MKPLTQALQHIKVLTHWTAYMEAGPSFPVVVTQQGLIEINANKPTTLQTALCDQVCLVTEQRSSQLFFNSCRNTRRCLI